MRIANPIYDVVLKYLLEDRKSAILLLEAFTGFDIEELSIQPQEKTKRKPRAELKAVKAKQTEKGAEEKLSIEERLGITIFRLDFKAIVRKRNGEQEVVIIELQKAMLSGDIMRFRAYLGQQYSDSSYFSTEKSSFTDRTYKKGYPVHPVYILGSPLPQIQDVPVLLIRKQVIDKHTGKEIQMRDDFIDSLYHEGIVISVPYLENRQRNELERLLSIFDQSFAIPDLQNHILELSEKEFPEKYKRILRRLFKAAQDIELREEMDKQDQALEELEELELSLEEPQKALKEEREALEKEREALKNERIAHDQTRKLSEEEKNRAQTSLSEAKSKEEEARKREEEARKREEEARKREEEARKREEEARKREEEARKREEEARKREEEARKREEKIRKEILGNPEISTAAAASILNISEEEVKRLKEKK